MRASSQLGLLEGPSTLAAVEGKKKNLKIVANGIHQPIKNQRNSQVEFTEEMQMCLGKRHLKRQS